MTAQSQSGLVLEVRDVTRVFDGLKAVDKVSLSIHPGEAYVLLGENGAGKSTLINMILDFIPPTSGEIRVMGMDMSREPLRGKEHLAYVPENVMLYGELSALENLVFFASLGGREFSQARAQETLGFVRLPEESHRRRVGTFSKGMRQKVALAIAIARDPRLLLLDEPTSGLDPRSAADLMEILESVVRGGKSLLMSTHDLLRAMSLPGRLGVMRQGRIVFEKSSTELRGANLERIYLDLTSSSTDTRE